MSIVCAQPVFVHFWTWDARQIPSKLIRTQRIICSNNPFYTQRKCRAFKVLSYLNERIDPSAGNREGIISLFKWWKKLSIWEVKAQAPWLVCSRAETSIHVLWLHFHTISTFHVASFSFATLFLGAGGSFRKLVWIFMMNRWAIYLF